MSHYERTLFPLLCRMDPETAHDWTVRGLECAQILPPGLWALRAMAGKIPREPVTVCGLTFPNVLGVAAGLDKDGRVARALAELGFGHVEIGTLTPRSQPGNPRPRIFRLPEDRALVNRMGFPNGGVRAATARVARRCPRPRRFILGVSIGKQKDTPLERAARDYVAVMRASWREADYLAVNISSPNTPGLRALQGGEYLPRLLAQLVEESRRLARKSVHPRRPLFVKIAPDLDDGELVEILDAIERAGIDGLIATNTTLAREGLRSPRAREQGGLSGAPLRIPSTRLIHQAALHTGGNLPIVAVGGVMDARDVEEKLAAGASLVQLYTGVVYGGPGLAGRILRARRRNRHGHG